MYPFGGIPKGRALGWRDEKGQGPWGKDCMAKNIDIGYVPTDKQRLFHESAANEVLYGGAAGGGKSKAIVMDAFARCMRYPLSKAYIFRRTYRELEDTIIAEALASYPKQVAVYNVGRHEMAFLNGSKVFFRHCQSAADMYDYAGAEIHWLYFDELTSFEREIYEFLKTRLRAKKALGIVPVVRCSSNPGNIGHSWVKAMFVDAGAYFSLVTHEVKSEVLHATRRFTTQYIPAFATDNPHISREYIFELERKDPNLRRALLYGDWDAFEGQAFPDIINDAAGYQSRLHTHIIAPFEIPPSWQRALSFDFGYSKPFSLGWWAIATDGTAYRYREWYGCEPGRPNTGLKLTPRQIAEGIVVREELESRENLRVDRIADPSIFDRSRGDSVAQQMEPTERLRGVYFRPGDNTRLAGKAALHERLRFDKEGRPAVYVFNTCRDWIRTVPSLPYDKRKVEDVDTEAEDHAYDDTRYFLMSRPMPVREYGKAVKQISPFVQYRG